MENDTPGEEQGLFLCWAGYPLTQPPKQLKKIPGASAGTGLGGGRRDLLKAALPLKDVFLEAGLSPRLAGTCFTAVAAETRCCCKRVHWDMKVNAFKEKEEGLGVPGVSS